MNERQRIDQLLKTYSLSAKKSFGQNFLIDDSIIRRIVNAMDISSYEHVIEIGPGLGSLTLPLYEKAKALIAVDADRDMVRVLNDLFRDKERITIINSDFLRFDPDQYSAKENRLLIGNLPYNITSELLEYMLDKGFVKAGCMVQKEVAEKLDYKPGKKENNALGAFIRACGHLEKIADVDRSCFYPAPNVDSAFISITMEEKVDFKLYPIFKAIFKDPNKTIGNCLKQFKKYENGLLYLKEERPELIAYRARQMEAKDLVSLAEMISEHSEASR